MPRSESDDILPDLAARALPEREGLPRNYRMRADAHYVDQLEAPAPPVIRMVKVGQIDCRDVPATGDLEALTRSIRLHGILQPLLVRRHGGRYALIAGRKRLAAAMAAGVATVPCALHDVEGQAAAALAEADNLRADAAPADDGSPPEPLQPVLEALDSDLSTVRTSLSLLRAPRGGGLSQKVGIDLIEAQIARAEWLVGSLLGTFADTRPVPVAVIVQRVSRTFEGLGSLAGLELEVSVSPAAAVWRLPDDPATAAIKGAVFAAVSCLEGTPRPRIELRADVLQTRTLRIEVVQRSARVAARIGQAGFDSAGAADVIPALALRLARLVATPQGGGAELTPLPGAGSVMQITFGLTS